MNAAKANCRAARATAAGAGRNGLAGRRPNRRARPACTAPVAGPRPPLRRFPRRWAPTTPRASETKQEDLAKAEEAKVEELVGVRLVRDKESGKPFVQYLVKWEDEYEDSWEAADDISEDLLRNYEDKWWRAVKTGEYDVVVSSPSLQYPPLSLSLSVSLKNGERKNTEDKDTSQRRSSMFMLAKLTRNLLLVTNLAKAALPGAGKRSHNLGLGGEALGGVNAESVIEDSIGQEEEYHKQKADYTILAAVAIVRQELQLRRQRRQSSILQPSAARCCCNAKCHRPGVKVRVETYLTLEPLDSAVGLIHLMVKIVDENILCVEQQGKSACLCS